MLAEQGLELIRELQRANDYVLPSYNEDGIRQIIEEMQALFQQNQEDVNATIAGKTGLFSAIQLRHASLERNKRCLLVYVYERMQRLRQLRWELGSVLPAHIKDNLCELEKLWFTNYSKSLVKYMRSFGDIGLDLTQDLKPPKSIFIEVRCLQDYGEFVTDDGEVIPLKKNTQHYMRRSQCEHLIRQGILEHVN